MRVLLTNDDGWNSTGLTVLREELQRANHHPIVVAPDRPRSACSHAITPFKPLSLTKHSQDFYISSGTPADCVLLALRGIAGLNPEVVLSGINHGANLGRDVIFSGTVAAARQAVFMDLPGIAVSLCIEPISPSQPADFRPIAALIAQRLAQLSAAWRPDHLININAPLGAGGPEMLITSLSHRKYEERFSSFAPPDSSTSYFLMDGHPVKSPEDSNSDFHTVLQGHISLSLLQVHYQNVEHEQYRQFCASPVTVPNAEHTS